MVVVLFNGVDVTLHSRSRGILQREAGGSGRNTEVGKLAAGYVVHESCMRAVR